MTTKSGNLERVFKNTRLAFLIDWPCHLDRQTLLRRCPLYAFIIGVILWRLVLPLRAGSFGGDQAELALRAHSILEGAGLPLVGTTGTFGVPYGPYPIYFLSLLYGVTGFHLGWATLLSSILLVVMCFLLASVAPDRIQGIWILLLALTSPLVINLSMAGLLWDPSYLLPLSALALFVSVRFDFLGETRREFIIGLLLGVSLAIHLQAVPFVFGIGLWRVFTTRRRLTPILALASGMVLAVAPYALGLWQFREHVVSSLMSLNRVTTFASDPVVIVTGLFRSWGASPFVRSNTDAPLATIERGLIDVTTAVTLALLLAGVGLILRKRQSLSSGSPRAAFAYCAAFYYPFVIITHTGATFAHWNNALWWGAPVVIPAIVLGLMPRRAGTACLSLLVAFNLLTTLVQYVPVLVRGTSAMLIAEYDVTYAMSHDVSWWMQEQVVREVCAIVGERHTAGYSSTLVKIAPVQFVRDSLPRLVRLQGPPGCYAQVKWAPEEQETYDVLIERDADGVHLRVVYVARRID